MNNDCVEWARKIMFKELMAKTVFEMVTNPLYYVSVMSIVGCFLSSPPISFNSWYTEQSFSGIVSYLKTACHWFNSKRNKGLSNAHDWNDPLAEVPEGGSEGDVGVLRKVLMLNCKKHSEGPLSVCSWSFSCFGRTSFHYRVSTWYSKGSLTISCHEGYSRFSADPEYTSKDHQPQLKLTCQAFSLRRWHGPLTLLSVKASRCNDRLGLKSCTFVATEHALSNLKLNNTSVLDGGRTTLSSWFTPSYRGTLQI